MLDLFCVLGSDEVRQYQVLDYTGVMYFVYDLDDTQRYSSLPTGMRGFAFFVPLLILCCALC